jgi:hypothetical protein
MILLKQASFFAVLASGEPQPLVGIVIHPLLPDGRIFGQITQKRPQKIGHGRKKLEAVKWHNLAKSGRKEAGKFFLQLFGLKTI